MSSPTPPRQLAQQADAGRCATTADQAIPYQRHMSCRHAVDLLSVGDQAAALWHMLWSVEKQAGMAGLGRVDLMRVTS